MDWPLSNKVATPDTLSFVEDAAANIYNTLFGQIPFLSWKETRGFQKSKLTERLSNGTNWLVEANIDEFSLEQYSAQHIKAMYGTSHFGVFPAYDMFRDEEVCVGASYVTADYWDILPCPYDVVGGRRARYQWHREFLPEDEVEKLFEEGVFSGDLDNMPKSGDKPEDQWHKELLREVGWEDYPLGGDDLIEVFHRYADGHIITVLNRGYIARDTRTTSPKNPPLPYNVPFTDMRYITFPKEYWGMGVAEALEQLQRDKNLIRSLHRENVDMSLSGIIKVNRNADVDLDTLEFYPQALWLMENMDDVEVYTPPDVTTQSVLAIEQQIMQDMERAAGRTRYGMGQTPPHARETATTVLRLQQAGLARLDTQIRLTESVAIRRLGWQLAKILQEKLHEEIFTQVVGASREETFADTDKWDLEYKVDAHPLGGSITRIEELRTEQMIRILEIAKSIDPRLFQLSPEKRQFDYGQLVLKVLVSSGLSQSEAEAFLPRVEEGGGIQPGQLGAPDEIAQVQQAIAQAKGGRGGA